MATVKVEVAVWPFEAAQHIAALATQPAEVEEPRTYPGNHTKAEWDVIAAASMLRAD